MFQLTSLKDKEIYYVAIESTNSPKLSRFIKLNVNCARKVNHFKNDEELQELEASERDTPFSI